ncbi:MAG TPA: FAD-dependent oxidoreductase [Acetobacteraceae bacterium]|nr:FAD-dependent oxidoreductase [Acetobacteraceae bacterium]
MPHSQYLIVGSSHAALEAATAIRLHDAEGSVTLLTREHRLPYSPTILPYIVSGRSRPEEVTLRDEIWFAQNGVALRRNSEVVRVDPATQSVTTAAGKVWTYDRLLLATGGTPVMPMVPGLSEAKPHVLHTMDDAIALRDAIKQARSAIVLGAGLCGMHVAEGMAKAGLQVSVLIRSRPLREYFSPRAGNLIQAAFAGNGAQMLVGRTPAAVERDGDGCAVTLDDGRTVAADLLMVGTGVTPAMAHLAGSGLETGRGILVDDRMRTSVAGIWAAGDVAEARSFWGGKTVNGILPGAVEHGRIAGADMAQDAALRPFAGAMGLNTYHYFEHHAVSVGLGGQLPDTGEFEIDEQVDAGREKYRRIVMQDGRLVGFASIDDFADPGVMWQLILRRTDLTAMKAAFLAQPQATARRLMSRLWR